MCGKGFFSAKQGIYREIIEISYKFLVFYVRCSYTSRLNSLKRQTGN